MKKVLLILILTVFCSGLIYSQDTTKLKGFNAIILPEYASYFTQAELMNNGSLNLTATEKYIHLSLEDKKPIVSQVLAAWQDSLILINYSSFRELWGWGSEKGKAKLYDQWDFSSRMAAPTIAPQVVPVNHPWFYYVGGQIGGDNYKNTNLALNLRLGFFLLLNRWDLAATVSGGMNINSGAVSYGGEPTTTSWSNLGLMSRVHFPIKKTGFSPTIGFEVTSTTYGKNSADVNAAFVLGFSWFIGFGSLDLAVKISEETSGMGGCTIYPRAKK